MLLFIGASGRVDSCHFEPMRQHGAQARVEANLILNTIIMTLNRVAVLVSVMQDHLNNRAQLTRAPVAVSANFSIVGGGICYHPLLTQKPIGLERCGKKHSIALNRYV